MEAIIFDSRVCVDMNVTYAHRVDDPANYNWCIVPESAYDAILFAGVALLVACIVSGRLSAVWVLVAGALCEVASYRANLGRFGNSVALWLGGIHPGEVFFYTFLPPLLLDSAARVDFFIFKKVLVLSLMFAFVLVCTTTLLAVPLMLWGLGLGPRYGWGWADVALFNAMIASTDAVAVTSVLRAGGAPELLGALLEGESLFNDASGIVLFDIFLRKVLQARRAAAGASHMSVSAASFSSPSSSSAALHHHHLPFSPLPGPAPAPTPSPAPWWPPSGWLPGSLPNWVVGLFPELAAVCREFAWLVVGGLAVGLACGLAMKWALRLLQWRHLKPHVEVSFTFAAGYLAFYIANAYLQASGVIAVVVFGVYGAATGMWGLSSQARRAGAFDRFWDVLSFCINGLIFFLLGASAVNYLIRLGVELNLDGGTSQRLLLETLLMLPLLYLSLFAMRGLLIAAFCFAARAINHRRLRKYAAAKAAAATGATAPGRGTGEEVLPASGDYRTQGTQSGAPGGEEALLSTSVPCSNLHPHRHPDHLPQDSQQHSQAQSNHAAQEAAAALAATPDWRGMIFATVGGLRGAVSLIMAQIVLAAIGSQSEKHVVGGNTATGAAFGGAVPGSGSGVGWGPARRDKEVTAQMVVWTSGFVLMTLVVNAPLLTPLMTLLRLNTTSPIKQMVRARAKAALRRFTANTLDEMKAAAELADGTDGSGGLDMSLMLLSGVDWAAVERAVDLTRKLDAVFPGASATPATTTATTTAKTAASIRTPPFLCADHHNARAAGTAAGKSSNPRKHISAAASTSMTRRRSGEPFTTSASLLEPLIPPTGSPSTCHSRRDSLGYGRKSSYSYGCSQPGRDEEPQKGSEGELGKGPMERVSMEAAVASRSHSVVRFEDDILMPLGRGMTTPADGSAVASAAMEPGTDGPLAASCNNTGNAVRAIAAAAGAGHRHPVHSAFGLPTAIAAATAAAAATGAAVGVPTTAALGEISFEAATAAATATASSSQLYHLHQQEHGAPLLHAVRMGPIAAAAATAAAGAPGVSPSVVTPAPGPGPEHHGLLGPGADAASVPANASSQPYLNWEAGGADDPAGCSHISTGCANVSAEFRRALGASAGMGHMGKKVLRRAVTATTLRDRSRSQMLDEQFTALQLPDAPGLLECPFASYAAPEASRRGPRESASTTATASPRASALGYLATAPMVAQVPLHAAAITADAFSGTSPPVAAAAAGVSPRKLLPPQHLTTSTGLLLPNRRRDLSPLTLAPSPSSSIPAGPEANALTIGPRSRLPSDAGADHHQTPEQQAYDMYQAGGCRTEDTEAADVEVGSFVAFALAGHLGPVDSSPSDSLPSPSEIDMGRRLQEGAAAAAEGEDGRMAAGQDVSLGSASVEWASPDYGAAGNGRTAAAEVFAGCGNDLGNGHGGGVARIRKTGAAEDQDRDQVEGGRGNFEEGKEDGDRGRGPEADMNGDLFLMSSSAPARFHGFGLEGARVRKLAQAAAVSAPVRPEQPSGAHLEALEEEQQQQQQEEQQQHEQGQLDAQDTSCMSQGNMARPGAVGGNGAGDNGDKGDGASGRSRRLSDPGSGPGVGPLAGQPLSSQSGDSVSAAASRRQRMLQTRMSPSFAIGVGTQLLRETRADDGGTSGLTLHPSLNRAAGAASSSSYSSPSFLAASNLTRIVRQPSSRWFSVTATHRKQPPPQHAEEGGLEAPARAVRASGGLSAPAVATAAASVHVKPHRAAASTGAEAVVAEKVLASSTRGAIHHQPLTRRWASLQELAGHHRALDAFCPRKERRRREGVSSSSGGGCGSSSSSSRVTSSGVRMGSQKADVEELMMEYRIRLLAGFKRFFHEEALEGVLSPSGMRLLCHCCDEALHQPSAPLDLWSAVEREVVGRGLVQWQAWAHLVLRRCMQRTLRWESPAKWLLPRPMRVLAEMLSSSLSRVMLVAMEVAVELAAVLSDSSPQLQWLRHAGHAGRGIWAEVSRQGAAVRRFILDRVIEAPDRFQATQSHRAALALLRQQVAFVRSMLKTGLVDGDEAEALMEPIERRIWRLEARGPRWQQPTLTQVLASCALLRGVSPSILDWLRAEGDLWAFPRGADLTPLLANGGVFIVVMGTVRVSLKVSAPSAHEPGHSTAPPNANPTRNPNDSKQDTPHFYVGVGGVVGMSTALLGWSVPGMAVAEAVAEGNTLGKGPVVFVLPPAAVATVRARAAAGWLPFQALLLNMYRLVGAHVLERQRGPLVTHIAALLTDAVAHAARTGGRKRAARLRELLVGDPQSVTADRKKPPTGAATTSLRRKQKAVLDEMYDAPAAGLLTSMASGGAAAAGPRNRSRRLGSGAISGDDSSSRGQDGVDDAGERHWGDSGNSHETSDEEEDQEEEDEGDIFSDGSGNSSSGGGGTEELNEHSGRGLAASKVAAALAEDELLSRRCLERSSEIADGVRRGIKAASLVLLQPGQPLLQRSTLVLLNGMLLQHPNSYTNKPTTTRPPSRLQTQTRGPQTHSLPPARHPLPVCKPPTILLWLPDHCEAAVARMFRQSDHIKYVAGPTGAAVLVIGAEEERAVVYQ